MTAGRKVAFFLTPGQMTELVRIAGGEGQKIKTSRSTVALFHKGLIEVNQGAYVLTPLGESAMPLVRRLTSPDTTKAANEAVY